MQFVQGTSLFPNHFNGKRFFNPNAPQARGFLEAARWALTRKPESSPKFVSDVRQTKPVSLISNREMVVTVVNHSTVLLQLPELTILTDPIWSKRPSPVQFAGPRRRRSAGVALEDLPKIDIVLISHNHYDHLDIATLKYFASKKHSTFVVPTGVAPVLRKRAFLPVFELDWGDALVHKDLKIHGVPALHFSARGIFDRNRTLWCGFWLEVAGSSIYFAGDTGFGEHFGAIRQRHGSPRLALLPIGAYDPPWFMSPIHMGPKEALDAHQILRARTSIGIHHGTFQLTDEGIDTPKRELERLRIAEEFYAPANGESIRLPL